MGVVLARIWSGKALGFRPLERLPFKRKMTKAAGKVLWSSLKCLKLKHWFGIYDRALRTRSCVDWTRTLRSAEWGRYGELATSWMQKKARRSTDYIFRGCSDSDELLRHDFHTRTLRGKHSSTLSNRQKITSGMRCRHVFSERQSLGYRWRKGKEGTSKHIVSNELLELKEIDLANNVKYLEMIWRIKLPSTKNEKEVCAC